MKRLFFIPQLVFLVSLFFFFSTSVHATNCCPQYYSPTSETECSMCYGGSCNVTNTLCNANSEKCDVASNTCIGVTATPIPTETIDCCSSDLTFKPIAGDVGGGCYSGSVEIIASKCSNIQYCEENVCKDLPADLTADTIPDTAQCGNSGQCCCNGTLCASPLVCGYTAGAAGRAPGLCSYICMDEGTNEKLNGTPTAASGNIFDVYCVQGKPESGINTALGCIDVSSPQNLITVILRIATGAGGGIALILILYGVFIVTTSAGNPDKLKSGSEIITSAIIGLIFVLLSVFLVNLIGINILGIPGLS